MVVGGNEDARWTDLNCTPFDLSCIPIVVRPYFKVVREPGMFRAKVIKQNGLSLLVAIPPFVKALVIDCRMLLSNGAALSNTRWSIEPDVIQFWYVHHLRLAKLVQLSSPQYLLIVFKRKLTGFD